MHSVTVKRTELLATVTANREKHRQVFLEAQESYREQVVAELEGMLSEARSGRRIRRSVQLVEPIDQTREYDRAIRMIQMAVGDTVEVSEDSFRNYVLDEWHWSGQFLAANYLYSKTLQDAQGV